MYKFPVESNAMFVGEVNSEAVPYVVPLASLMYPQVLALPATK
jgi:hypothetical protein